MAAPATHVRVGGVWKKVTSVWIKVGGVWKRVTAVHAKTSGTWKQAHEDPGPP